jgi:hypothetical protein
LAISTTSAPISRARWEVGQTHACAENDHPALFQVTAGPQRDIGFGHLAHGDGGLNPGHDALLLEEVLQREAVHHGAQHAHVVRTGAFHTALLKLSAAEEVPAADHHRDLNAAAHHFGDLPGHLGDHVGVQSHRAAAEHLPAELEQYPRVLRPQCPGAVRRGLAHRTPSLSGQLHEFAD